MSKCRIVASLVGALVLLLSIQPIRYVYLSDLIVDQPQDIAASNAGMSNKRPSLIGEWTAVYGFIKENSGFLATGALTLM